jgi:hypothetical protein
VVVWAVLGVLTAAIAVLEARDHLRAPADAGRDARRLLPVPADQLGALEIAEAGRLHRFERDPGGGWFYHGAHGAAEAGHVHAPDPALAERIERAVAAFGRTRMERDFEQDGDGSAYGLATPEILVLVYRPNERQPLAQYAVGSVAPDTASRYVSMVGRPGVVTIPAYQIDNLLSLVQEASTAHAAGAVTEPSGPTAGARR